MPDDSFRSASATPLNASILSAAILPINARASANGCSEWFVGHSSGGVAHGARSRSSRSRLKRCAACSRGSAPSFALRSGPRGIGSAPVRRRQRSRVERSRRKSCGASWLTPVFAANSLTRCDTSFSMTSSPQGLPMLFPQRKTFPISMPAALIHSLSWPWTPSGTGTVRT